MAVRRYLPLVLLTGLGNPLHGAELQSLQGLTPASLQEKALIFGSYRYPGETDHRLSFRIGETDGAFALIRGEAGMKLAEQEATDDPEWLFAALVDPGKYRFAATSSFAMNTAVAWEYPVPAAPLTVAAGDILYLGNARCLVVANACEWMVTDTWNRDVAAARQRNADIAWDQARRADLNFNASWYHEKFQIETLGKITGDANLRDFELLLPEKLRSFTREGAANFGNQNLMIRYRATGDGEATYDVMLYRASHCHDDESAAACDPREHAEGGLHEALAAAHLNWGLIAGSKKLGRMHDVFSEKPVRRTLELDSRDGGIAGAEHEHWRPVIETLHAARGKPQVTWQRIAVLARNGWFMKLRLRHPGTRDDAKRMFDTFYAELFGERLRGVAQTEE